MRNDHLSEADPPNDLSPLLMSLHILLRMSREMSFGMRKYGWRT